MNLHFGLVAHFEIMNGLMRLWI